MNHGIARGLAALLLVLGCGDEGGFIEDDILDQAPTGRIAGEPWTAVEGGAELDPATGRFFVQLFAEDVDECSRLSPSGLGSVLTVVPGEVGVYPLNLRSVVVTFVDGDNVNFISDDGLLVVEEITETTVTLGLVALVGESDINGRLVLQRCD